MSASAVAVILSSLHPTREKISFFVCCMFFCNDIFSYIIIQTSTRLMFQTCHCSPSYRSCRPRLGYFLRRCFFNRCIILRPRSYFIDICISSSPQVFLLSFASWPVVLLYRSWFCLSCFGCAMSFVSVCLVDSSTQYFRYLQCATHADAAKFPHVMI
jgi:hypothetical protein